jgi:hypothetical protein
MSNKFKIEIIEAPMINETKQTAVEWLLNEWPILNSELPQWLIEQAKEMEIADKELSYADGYSAGYDRALELVEWKIKHELKIDNK